MIDIRKFVDAFVSFWVPLIWKAMVVASQTEGQFMDGPDEDNLHSIWPKRSHKSHTSLLSLHSLSCCCSSTEPISSRNMSTAGMLSPRDTFFASAKSHQWPQPNFCNPISISGPQTGCRVVSHTIQTLLHEAFDNSPLDFSRIAGAFIDINVHFNLQCLPPYDERLSHSLWKTDLCIRSKIWQF